jgi:hypothetical protein
MLKVFLCQLKIGIIILNFVLQDQFFFMINKSYALKSISFYLAVFLFMPFLLISQTTLPNMSFEDWTSYGGGQYEEPSGGVWTTANKAVLLTALIPASTEKTTDAYSGTYAAKMSTKMASAPLSMLITGTLATGTFDEMATPPNNLNQGMPFTGRPQQFTGYYKYIDNAGDSCEIYAILSKWNGSARQEVGRAYMRSTLTVTSYTKFDLPFSYTSADTPDSISVVFASSAGGDQMVGTVGSTLYIDSIAFIYPSGINDLSVPSINIHCFPVPSNDYVTFKLDRTIYNGSIKIFNELGSEIIIIGNVEKELVLPVNNLSKGKYFYQITEENKILTSGSFMVN